MVIVQSFFPSMCTTSLQPLLNQGITQTLKQGYGKCMVKRLLAKLLVGEGFKIDLLDFLAVLNRAGYHFSLNAVRNCSYEGTLQLESTEPVITVPAHNDDSISTFGRNLVNFSMQCLKCCLLYVVVFNK